MQGQLGRRLGRELQRGSGLSSADYEVLVNLSEAPGHRLRAYELGRALQWEKSRISHHLTRMQGRGLIERKSCPTDGRGAFVTLTETGLRGIEEAAPEHVEAVRRYFIEAMDPGQLDDFATICESVSGRLAEASGPADDCDESEAQSPSTRFTRAESLPMNRP